MRTRSRPGHVGLSHVSGDAESLEARGILVQMSNEFEET